MAQHSAEDDEKDTASAPLEEVTCKRDLSSWSFQVPQKTITSEQVLEEFLKSETCLQFEKFLARTSRAVQNKKASAPCQVSPVLQRFLGVLDMMESWLIEIPPLQQPMRYGNMAFRDYGKKLLDSMDAIMITIFGSSLPEGGRRELGVYLYESIGNTTRIDYGTGHETNFVALLFCLEVHILRLYYSFLPLRELDQFDIVTDIYFFILIRRSW